MPKLTFAILTVMIAVSGIESTPAATATQVPTPIIGSITPLSAIPNVTNHTQRIAINKGCTIKRYRRPRQ
jgi:hypothetical protein